MRESSGNLLGTETPRSFDVPARIDQGGFPLIALSPLSSRRRDQWVRDTTLGLDTAFAATALG